MANHYRELLTTPGATGLVLASSMALATAMIGIGIITMLVQQTGVYWLAGAVAGTFTLANALLGPHISRLVDQHGQSRVLPVVTAFTVAMLLALITRGLLADSSRTAVCSGGTGGDDAEHAVDDPRQMDAVVPGQAAIAHSVLAGHRPHRAGLYRRPATGDRSEREFFRRSRAAGCGRVVGYWGDRVSAATPD